MEQRFFGEPEENFRKQDFKRGIVSEDQTRKRDDDLLSLRKNKREAKLRKKRLVSYDSVDTSQLETYIDFNQIEIYNPSANQPQILKPSDVLLIRVNVIREAKNSDHVLAALKEIRSYVSVDENSKLFQIIQNVRKGDICLLREVFCTTRFI